MRTDFVNGDPWNYTVVNALAAEVNDGKAAGAIIVGPTGNTGYITDGTADNVEIQAAITAVGSTGGTVELQKGTYNLAAGLTITNSNATLRGQGFGGVKLLLNNSVNATVITVSGTGTVGVTIANLSIDGNKANQTSGHGIQINTPYSSTDCFHLLQNIDIMDAKQTGISVIGDTRIVRAFMLRVKHCGNYGYNLAGSDHDFTNCIADNNQWGGFEISGGNSRYTTCNSFWNNASVTTGSNYAGFHVVGGARNMFVGCQAQDNYEHGWIIDSATGTLMVGCVGDSNGQGTAGGGAGSGSGSSGVMLWDSHRTVIIGGAFFDRAANTNHQDIGLRIGGVSANNVFQAYTAYGNATKSMDYTTTGTGNLITVADSTGVMDTEQFITLTSAYTLTSQTAAQKMFNATTNGAVTLPVGTYFFECFFDLSSISSSSGSFGWTLAAGTATIAAIKWFSTANKATLATAAASMNTVNTAANTALVTANTTQVGWAKITGKVRISVAGTVIPQVSLGVAAAAVVGADSYFRIWDVGLNTTTNAGVWS